MTDVSTQLYKAPWQTPNQFAAYCKAIERSRQVLAKRQERKAEFERNRCAKEAHSDDRSALREMKVAHMHASKREKLREMIRRTKELSNGCGSGSEDAPPSRVTLVSKRSTIVVAPRRLIPGGPHASSSSNIDESTAPSSPVEATKRVRVQHFLHDDEIGFIDVDDGTSDEDEDDETSDESPSTTAEFEDPRFVAKLVSEWDEIERSQSLTSTLMGRTALSKSALSAGGNSQTRSVAMMLASERPNAQRALITLEEKRRKILEEDEDEALNDAVGRWQKLHYHIHHTERLTAVRILNLDDQQSARRTVVDVKEQQAWKLLMAKEMGQRVQAKHRQTVRENMTAKEAYWANARQKEIQKLKEMAERMLMDVKHHTQEEDPINRMPPRHTRLASAIFATTPVARRSVSALAAVNDPRIRRTSSAVLADGGVPIEASGRRATVLLAPSLSFRSPQNNRRETVLQDHIPDEWTTPKGGEQEEEGGGLTEKQRHAMNERWKREAKMLGDKLRKELVTKENSPDHARVYDQMEAQRQASKSMREQRDNMKSESSSEYFHQVNDVPTRKQSEDQLKDPFFLKLEEARRKKHADMLMLVEKAEASKNKSLANVVDLVVTNKEVHGEEVLEPRSQQPMTRWFRERSIVHTNFFTGQSPTSPGSRKQTVSLQETASEHVSFEADPSSAPSPVEEATHSLSFGGFGSDSRPNSIALSSFSTSQDAATIQTDLLDATMNREGVRRRSSAFYKLKEIGQQVIALRRLSCGHGLEESSPSHSPTEHQELNVKRERQNLATLVVASGLGRKNVEATRRENLQSLDETGSPMFKRNQSVQSKALSSTPATEAPGLRLPEPVEYTAFSEQRSPRRPEPILQPVASSIDQPHHLFVSSNSSVLMTNSDTGTADDEDDEDVASPLEADPCAKTMPLGSVRPQPEASLQLPAPSIKEQQPFTRPMLRSNSTMSEDKDGPHEQAAEWVLAEEDLM